MNTKEDFYTTEGINKCFNRHTDKQSIIKNRVTLRRTEILADRKKTQNLRSTKSLIKEDAKVPTLSEEAQTDSKRSFALKNIR